MRILYVSRHFNRSGYYILEHLLRDGRYTPVAVLLPRPKRKQWLDDPVLAPFEALRYTIETRYYRCRPVRFMKSLKRLARRHRVPVLELASIKTEAAYATLKSLNLDLIVLGGGWPELIPRRVIRLPRLGVINTHPSLLPEFRGTDVHRWQICTGVSTSGMTIHYIDEQFDTGDIIDQVAIKVTDEDIPQSLFEKAARASVSLMARALDRIAEAVPNRVQGIKQKRRDDKSRYFSRWHWNDRDFLRIDWTRSARENWRFIRACCQESYKYNGPFFTLRGKEYIIREASLAQHQSGVVGEICIINAEGVGVRCGSADTILMIQQIQRGGPDLIWSRGHPGAWFTKREGMQVGDNLMALSKGEQRDGKA